MDYANSVSPLRLTLVANAGVAVCAETGKILIDTPAPEQAGVFPYSGVPEAVFAAEFFGEGRFANAAAMLYTHAHSDHFSPALLLRYLTRNRVGTLLLPATERRLDIEYAAWGSDCQIFSAPCVGQPAMTLPLCGGMLTAFPTRHMGQEHFEEPHCCLLLELCGRRLLFLGDAAPACVCRLKIEAPLDAVFATPPFLHAPDGHAFLERLRPARILVYHVPFAGRNDGQRRAAHIEAQKYQRTGRETLVLDERFQTIEI